MRSPVPKAPPVQKTTDHEKLNPSAAQLNPSLCSPTDFEVMENGGLGGETLPFDNSCGSTAAEYRKLLKIGLAGNKKAFIDLDEFGRTLKE